MEKCGQVQKSENSKMNNFENHKLISDFHIKINRDTVMHIMDCRKDSPVYEEVLEEYEELEKEISALIEPAAIIKFGRFDADVKLEGLENGAPVVYVLATAGLEISELSSRYFAEGDYLRGMLADAMADDYLFQTDSEVQKIIREECRLRRLGIHRRFEAPGTMPMEMQKAILDETEAYERLKIDITTGYMFTAVKTTGYLLEVTEDENAFHAGHNCEACEAVGCKSRKIAETSVKVTSGDLVYEIGCRKKESLLEAMVRNGIFVSAVCGGNGKCGKCSIQVLEGELEITAADREVFGQEELAAGFRLSCRAYPKAGCSIKLAAGNESDFEILSDYRNEDDEKSKAGEDSYLIGIDIGTTTIAITLVGAESKRTIKTFTIVNKQRAYGADVISRIQASNEGKKEELRDSVRESLNLGIREIVESMRIAKSSIKKIAVSGNTTMQHLLLGYSCETLGVFPFTPVDVSLLEKPFLEIMGNDYLQSPVVLLPGISTFVGSDIVSGLLLCDFDRKKEISMLIDLGTNCEMAIGNSESILVCSTAAGPAFEGGNIQNGTGSIPGAISSVSIEDGKAVYETIAGKPPVGICGTGAIETVAELLKVDLIDETGRLDEAYFEEGYELARNPEGRSIVFTQKDIREIQLAKSAVRAGIETLAERYGTELDAIARVYIAGGFGFKVDISKAVYIGLLPEEFSGKIEAVGNSSLGGAVSYLTEDGADKRVEKIVEASEEINLSADKFFNERYMEHMYFE